MPWIKVDDQMVHHPKIKPLSDAAFRWVHEGLSYANRFLTDGVLSPDFVAQVPAAVLAELTTVRVGQKNPVWHRTDDCHVVIHDFRDYQPTKSEVERERRKARKRQAKWRAAIGKNKRVSNGVTNTVINGAPTRHGPAPSIKRSPQPPADAGGVRILRGDLKHADQVRKSWTGRCHHVPACADGNACHARLARDHAQRRRAS